MELSFVRFFRVLQRLEATLAKIGSRCEQNVMDDNEQISSMDGETSSMDGSVILECHPWMENPHPWMISTHEDDR